MHKITKIFLQRFFPSLIILPFLACAGMKIGNLKETIDKYNKAIKWAGYASTAGMIEEAERQAILEKKLKEMNDKNVVEYSLGDLSLSGDGKSATALVQYSLINQKYQSLENSIELQLWKKIDGRWYLSKIINPNEKPQKGKHATP